jgi:hypothetical protein
VWSPTDRITLPRASGAAPSGIQGRALRKRAATSRVWIATGSVVSILWLMTVLASDAPWLVITLFWIVVGSALALWMRRDFAREDENVLFFVSGQEFYPEARFPSLDFSLVYPRDEEGGTVDFWIEKRADRAEPDRVIPARVKKELEIPESFAVLRADLDRIEEVLRQPDAAQTR